MICTFGDVTDVTWWRELQLPTRPVVGWDGRLHGSPPVSHWNSDALTHWNALAGKTVKAARKEIVELLRSQGDLVEGARQIVGTVAGRELAGRLEKTYRPLPGPAEPADGGTPL